MFGLNLLHLLPCLGLDMGVCLVQREEGAMSENRIVAECWTCTDHTLCWREDCRTGSQYHRPAISTNYGITVHLAAGHDVRPVATDPEPDHSIPYDGCACGDPFCEGCDVRPVEVKREA